MTEQKLTELLRDMSLEEKVNQMSQVTGGFFNGEIVVTGPMADKGFTVYKKTIWKSIRTIFHYCLC